MAKVGNEVKLILRLAKERMLEYNRAIQEDKELDAYYRQAYQSATIDYNAQFDRIISELEK